MKKAVVFTLGCKVNLAESASIMRGLSELGFEVGDKPAYADLYIINTCAVTKEAEGKSRQAVKRLRKFNANAPVIIAGCAGENSPGDFLEKERVIFVRGTRKKSDILSFVKNPEFISEETGNGFEELGLPLLSKTRADIKIQDGCNSFCSYCIVPYLRGRERSRKLENIRDEILALNPLEAVLTGINISSYNDRGINLSGLLRGLTGLDCRIRLGSLEANVIDEELLEAVGGLTDFAPHFHLSLQSGSESVLKRMNRRYTPEFFYGKVSLIREFFPDAGITTDVIAGFPDETEEEFLATLEFCKRVGFSDMHCFPFSARKGTEAYKLKELPKELKKERAERLIKLAEGLKAEFLRDNIGREQEIIAEEETDGYTTGYSGNYIKFYLPKGIKTDKIKAIGEAPAFDGLKGKII